ncbi:Arylsulfatase [Pirellulimonas nuda]|uniref:Arylsulfatase n=1 Tax=Pirellulimonas nuda TaxID=2528009 RepID=A0A518D9U7_9BACT|nr:sulfatase [Pirellulimonas nuda]QDU88259.1 Arylsulfatase [Pirellulimonas nuda]
MSRNPLAITLLLGCVAATTQAADRPNVLFIAIDDLNHWVGHLGRNRQAKTPNLDRLAASGVTFTSANCAAPACNPSRAALMSGLRPSSTGVYDNGQDWMPVISEEKTLTTQFLTAGYDVYGAGKIYHGSAHRPDEWTEYHKDARDPMKLHPTANGGGVGGIRFAPLANADQEMNDYKVASYAVKQLGAPHDKPFFLAVGLFRPHMPWCVPKKYFDMFPLESVELPPHQQDDLADVPAAGQRMAKPNGDHAAMLKSGRWKEAVQAYLASIAFCDVQVGRVLDALDASPEKDNTIVVLWSDHGWHLGEKEHWRKFSLWQEACRSVYIWRVPGLTHPGGVCRTAVDHMSIYPTLCSLTGIPKPEHVEGLDITPLLKAPDAPWQTPALTTFHKGNHSLQQGQHRYIRYADGGKELYDHSQDPYEWTNLAGDPSQAELIRRFEASVPKSEAEELPRGKDGEGKAPKNQRRKTAAAT